MVVLLVQLVKRSTVVVLPSGSDFIAARLTHCLHKGFVLLAEPFAVGNTSVPATDCRDQNVSRDLFSRKSHHPPLDQAAILPPIQSTARCSSRRYCQTDSVPPYFSATMRAFTA